MEIRTLIYNFLNYTYVSKNFCGTLRIYDPRLICSSKAVPIAAAFFITSRSESDSPRY